MTLSVSDSSLILRGNRRFKTLEKETLRFNLVGASSEDEGYGGGGGGEVPFGSSYPLQNYHPCFSGPSASTLSLTIKAYLRPINMRAILSIYF